jgi:cytochrome c oxidase assembly factor CtaG
VVIAVLLVMGTPATLAISGESGNGRDGRGPDLTMEQLGMRLGSTMQSDLRGPPASPA